jgi:hypothetical protein
VTGVRLSAAARITWRPTSVDPVKSRWSKGSATNARATSGPPLITESVAGSNGLGHEPREEGARFRRRLGHLHERAIARGERGDERPTAR